MTWDYAELSKLAKENGGPERLIEILIEAGVEAGKKKTLPLIGAAFAGGIVITLGVQKIIKYFSEKSKTSNIELENAKKEIIQGIDDYENSQSKLLEDSIKTLEKTKK